jgi:hypothetical protein
MKSQKEGGFGPPRAVTPWKKKNIKITILFLALFKFSYNVNECIKCS